MKNTFISSYLVYQFFIILNVAPAYIHTQNPACANVPNREKVDCLPGRFTTEADCIAKGCCWQPTFEPLPFCYYDSTHQFNLACISIPNNEKIDCLPGPTTTQKACIAEGCCWQQISEPGPYCYYNSTRKFKPACLNIPNKDKIDCLPGSATREGACIAKGCCWQPINEPGPYCYYDSTYYTNDPACINVPNNEKVDCLPGSTTSARDCIAKGCCWKPINEPGPNCYYKHAQKLNPVCASIPNDEKVDCLPGNATQDLCNSKGCCWNPTDSGIPPCFSPNLEPECANVPKLFARKCYKPNT